MCATKSISFHIFSTANDCAGIYINIYITAGERDWGVLSWVDADGCKPIIRALQPSYNAKKNVKL